MKNTILDKMNKPELIEFIKLLQLDNEKLTADLKALKYPKQDATKNSSLSATVGLYRSNGATFQEIADKLNADGHTNSRNNSFNKMTVQRLFKKYQSEQKQLLSK